MLNAFSILAEYAECLNAFSILGQYAECIKALEFQTVMFDGDQKKKLINAKFRVSPISIFA